MNLRLFRITRIGDSSGLIEVAAEGVHFSDGTCAVRWMSDRRCTTIYNRIDALVALHSEGGRARIEWVE